jgi:uncharacterized protein (TIGR02246 family)
MLALFAGSLKGSRAIHEVQRLRFPVVDTAIVISSRAVLLAGQTAAQAESSGLDTWVLAKHASRWLIEAFHTCPTQLL